MNERIKELAEQTFFDEATALPSDKMYTFSDHKMQKFAELIVRECCSIIEVDLETNKVKAETDNEGRIWVNAQLTFSQLIKSRFDIKE
jgi:hypothetical protein